MIAQRLNAARVVGDDRETRRRQLEVHTGQTARVFEPLMQKPLRVDQDTLPAVHFDLVDDLL